MPVLTADSSIQYVKGVGPARAELFAKAGLGTVGALLENYPFRHEAEPEETAIEDARPGRDVTIRGEVIRVWGDPSHARTAVVHDGTDSLALRWFAQPQVTRPVVLGATIVASGQTREYNGRLEIVHPKMQVSPPGVPLTTRPRRGSRFVGVYRGTGGLKSLLIRRAVLRVLEQPRLPVQEILPPSLVARRKLVTREVAVRGMHVHRNPRELEDARRRLAYEEFLLMETAIALRRRKLVSLQKARKLIVTPEIDARIRARFPFRLTNAQDQVVRRISRDLASGRPMTRLLQGDVGSGKTVVALYACLAAIAHGGQAAIMAPTEILAHQHFAKIQEYLTKSRVRAVLLRGGMGRRERAQALAALESGDMDLVVGTQALLEKDVAFHDLAMVVVDEQHKFGVLQRANFRTKALMPHYLVMTATPIPRTLSMTVFGDLDVSIMRESPPGRGRVITKVTPRSKWDVVMAYVRRRLEAGEQAYVVCPLIGGPDAPEMNDDSQAGVSAGEAGEEEGTAVASRNAQITARTSRSASGASRASRAAQSRSAKAVFEKLTGGPWKGLNVALLHGSMRADEKQKVMEAFARNRLHALVATTVVEVGVDVPNATVMVVESADRYGLSQLHQLRGRIGRGGKDGLCVLISDERDSPAPAATAEITVPKAAGSGGRQRASGSSRLAVLARTTDGFKIAEADLAFRGPGELFGTRQHGLPELRVGSIVEDFELLEQARQDAFEIVAADPTLSRPDHKRMIPALRRMFGDKLALIDAA